jgi:hypothetical protein
LIWSGKNLVNCACWSEQEKPLLANTRIDACVIADRNLLLGLAAYAMDIQNPVDAKRDTKDPTLADLSMGCQIKATPVTKNTNANVTTGSNTTWNQRIKKN